MAHTTRKSILDAIKAGDEQAWVEFYTIYSPLIKYCGIMGKLKREELDDLVQNVMTRIFKIQERFVYDPAKGKFRTYLGRVIKSCLHSMHEKQTEVEEVKEISSEKNWVDDVIDAEWADYARRHAFHLLKERVSETTFQAFEMLVVQEQPPKDVAAFLNIEIEKVYEAKRRCMKILREIVKELEE